MSIDWSRYVFNDRWFLPHEAAWDKELRPWMEERDAKTKSMHILEIGSYEGLSAVWLATNMMEVANKIWGDLGNAYAGIGIRLVCVDAWPGPEYQSIKVRCYENLKRVGIHPQFVYINAAPSYHVLPTLSTPFDFIYIDGSHKEVDVYFDTISSLRLIKPGGMILWDDYANLGTPGEELVQVRAGVDGALKDKGVTKTTLLGQHLRYDAPG
jgi:predicted O-methyltransferase YrrM